MKRFRYILAVILSLLIVYVGAGVSVAQYCCSGCETANCCCADKCGFCGKFDFEFHKSCRGEGCTATIYKLDLVKQAFESSVPAPVSLLLCDQVSDLLCALFRDEVLDPPYVIPPPKTSSRHYLALYSIFCICSLIFSISVFKSIAAFDISILFALDKVVLASLFISCAMKSIFLPIPPSSLRHFLACSI